jgi:hypothetical protein
LASWNLKSTQAHLGYSLLISCFGFFFSLPMIGNYNTNCDNQITHSLLKHHSKKYIRNTWNHVMY